MCAHVSTVCATDAAACPQQEAYRPSAAFSAAPDHSLGFNLEPRLETAGAGPPPAFPDCLSPPVSRHHLYMARRPPKPNLHFAQGRDQVVPAAPAAPATPPAPAGTPPLAARRHGHPCRLRPRRHLLAPCRSGAAGCCCVSCCAPTTRWCGSWSRWGSWRRPSRRPSGEDPAVAAGAGAGEGGGSGSGGGAGAGAKQGEMKRSATCMAAACVHLLSLQLAAC